MASTGEDLPALMEEKKHGRWAQTELRMAGENKVVPEVE